MSGSSKYRYFIQAPSLNIDIEALGKPNMKLVVSAFSNIPLKFKKNDK